MLGKSLITAASGAAGAGEALGIESLFQTWLYTGNNSTQTITNGIDLAGEGGMVWVKERNGSTYGHSLFDTLRGANNAIQTHTNAQQFNFGYSVSFQNDGFLLGSDPYSYVNQAYTTYASWTFRKAPGFFDVVTYTGNGVAGRTVPHNLGSVPGCIIVKRTSTTSNWEVYHRSLGNTYNLSLNTTDPAYDTGSSRWNSTTPTSSVFSVGTQVSVNASGSTYVAYLFAHDAGGFGDSGNESVIKCGSFTTDGSGNATVDLGWEPQWLLYRNPNVGANWNIEDTMRGAAVTTFGALKLLADSSAAEGSASRGMQPIPTGFKIEGGVSANATYIYIAIRRGPMKTPTDATEVFYPDAINTSAGQKRTTGFPVDWQILRNGRNLALVGNFGVTRLTGVSTVDGDVSAPLLRTYDLSAETNSTLTRYWDNSGYKITSASASTNAWFLNFRRAPGFFDVVAYTGTGVARTVPHNLGVAPELMIVKSRSAVGQWGVYSSALGIDYRLFLQLSDAAYSGSSTFWNATLPTSSVFSIGTNGNVNTSTTTYIAYLFASCPGVSKCFNYTGTGTTKQIDCGFTNGARLVLIKRTDSTGDWYIWDSARGIISGNDPYLLLNSTAAEVTNTDYIDPYSAGFEISSTAPAAINANGGSYIGLAIA